jgi:hypothetical protein
MIRTAFAVTTLGLLGITPAFAIAPNCADQLAEIKAQMTSEMLAQSALGNKYEEADRQCKAGNDRQAQGLARQIREEMASKAKKGQSSATESSGSSQRNAAGQKQ